MIERIHPVLLVAIGGIGGALARYYLSGLLKNSWSIPLGTLVVNILGSFILGYLFTLNRFTLLSSEWLILLGTGFMGSFTTMSTFVVETLNLSSESYNLGLLNFISTIALVFIGGFCGQALALLQIRGSF